MAFFYLVAVASLFLNSVVFALNQQDLKEPYKSAQIFPLILMGFMVMPLKSTP